MPKKIVEYKLLPLLREYIVALKKGRHIQINGKKVSRGSIENYKYLEKLLLKFSNDKRFELRIKHTAGNKRFFETEKKYWKLFYKKFTDYLYNDLEHFDNYVGSNIKLLKAFFNYIKNEKGIDPGNFYRQFRVPHEDIEIIVLSSDRLNFLITSKELEAKLSTTLQKVKDIFVFGCTVGLRYSDLMNLSEANIENTGNNLYLVVRSKKTQMLTRVKLPFYAVAILEKYKKSRERLLPYFNKVFLNKKLKQLMEIAGWTEPVVKTRFRRGIVVPQQQIRFCDLITTHTMRRTSITTMLTLGMNEQAVRKISGHAAGSREFYRYVSFAQSYMDNELDQVHKKLIKA